MCSVINILILLLLALIHLSFAKDCEKADFEYAYTECGTEGDRWRVSVLKHDRNCTIKEVDPPIKGSNCKTECKNGEYLDINTDSCVACPKGTYSFSGGMVFNTWNDIPRGFEISKEFYDDFATGSDCSKASWAAHGSYIKKEPSNCYVILSYAKHFIKKGIVEFEYQYPDESVYFSFDVTNEQCLSASGSDYDNINQLTPTGPGKWAVKTFNLTAGRNILKWTTSSAYDVSSGSPVYIRYIKITGIADAMVCTDCSAGYHNPTSGASSCLPCKPDSYSTHGASECSKCTDDKYSRYASDTCSPRPICKNKDYYKFYDACNNNNKTKLMYQWMEPKICKDGISLPKDEAEHDCSPCDLGTYPINGSHCAVCDSNAKVAINNTNCKTCPPNTQPVHGLVYTRWSRWPAFINATCESLSQEDCPSKNPWFLNQDHLAAGRGVGPQVYLLLYITIPGPFLYNNERNEITASLSVDFEMNCKGNCSLFLISVSASRDQSLEHVWTTSKGARQKFTYPIRNDDINQLVFLFEKKSNGKSLADWNDDYRDDELKIYSMNVTGVTNGPILSCEPCPQLSSSKGCVSCDKGKFYDSKSKSCETCPSDRVVSKQFTPQGACVNCGDNLIARNGLDCVSPNLMAINIKINETASQTSEIYRLQPLLNKTISARGSLLFTSSGQKYVHVFVFSLNNANASDLASCQSNMSFIRNNKTEVLRSLVCRMTIIPPEGKGRLPLSAQATSLGDTLVSVRHTNYSQEYRKEINAKLIKAGWSHDEEGFDLHYNFSAYRTTACPNGRTTIVTVRCGFEIDDYGTGSKNDIASVPPKCGAGTCDGCEFHFLYLTYDVCPQCGPQDVEIVYGECSSGVQEVYSVPRYYCYLGDRRPQKLKSTRHCPMISEVTQYAIIISAVLLIVLIILLCFCHKRNKKLEYKYMKLVEAHPGRNGTYDDDDAELPAVESCAVQEGEEDYDPQPHLKSKSRGGQAHSKHQQQQQQRKGPSMQFHDDAAATSGDEAQVHFKNGMEDIDFNVPSSGIGDKASNFFNKIRNINAPSGSRGFRPRRGRNDGMESVSLTDDFHT